YEYERAVREGFLVDYDVVKVKSDVRLKGIFLKEGEQVGVIDTESGAEQLDLMEDERQFEAQEVERKVTSPDSNRKIVEALRDHCAQHEQRYGRFPFAQALGRGAPVGERFPDKPHFTGSDCFGGTLIERFKQVTAITAEPPVGPSRTIGEIIEDIWNNRDRQYNIRCLVKRLQRI